MSNNELVLLRRIEELEKLTMRQPEIGGVWKDWTPTFPAGTMYLTSPTIGYAKYCTIGNVVLITAAIQGTLSGTAAPSFLIAFPFSVNVMETPILMSSHSTGWGNKGFIIVNGLNLTIYSEDYSNQTLGVNHFRINCFGKIN